MTFQPVSVSPVTPGVGPPVGPMTVFGPKVKVLVLLPVVSVKVVACVPLKLADCARASEGRPTPRATTTEAAGSAMPATTPRSWASRRESAPVEHGRVVMRELSGGDADADAVTEAARKRAGRSPDTIIMTHPIIRALKGACPAH